MNYDFRFFIRYSRRRKGLQWVEVYLWDVHPATFYNWDGGRWGYFISTYKNPRIGKFGELHFVKRRLCFDGIVHELDHLRTEWMWANGETITRRNEESMAVRLDQIARNFRKELRKVEPGIQL